jgi:hypothetical protein
MFNYQPDQTARAMILTTVRFTVQHNLHWDLAEKMILDRIEHKILTGDTLDTAELDTLFTVLQRLIDDRTIATTR